MEVQQSNWPSCWRAMALDIRIRGSTSAGGWGGASLTPSLPTLPGRAGPSVFQGQSTRSLASTAPSGLSGRGSPPPPPRPAIPRLAPHHHSSAVRALAANRPRLELKHVTARVSSHTNRGPGRSSQRLPRQRPATPPPAPPRSYGGQQNQYRRFLAGPRQRALSLCEARSGA